MATTRKETQFSEYTQFQFNIATYHVVLHKVMHIACLSHFVQSLVSPKKRNYLKSDMQKFLLCYHRLRFRHIRLVHLIPSIFFFAAPFILCASKSIANNLHTTNMPIHLKCVSGFVVRLKLHVHSGYNFAADLSLVGT